MSNQLAVSVGQYTDKGRKEINQDFHGLCIPSGQQLTSKGIAIALADGISSSEVSQVASQAAIGGFLEDYYCTSDAWSVKTSAQRVLMAVNSWLHAQTQQSQYRYDRDRGYVCTLSAMILKAATAYIFHVGDTRIYRLRGDELEQLTQDHRLWISQHKSYLSRALGVQDHLEMDYQTLALEAGDIFLFMTDGIYEYIDHALIRATYKTHSHDLDEAAKRLANEAYRQGSTDNLTVQIVRIDALPNRSPAEIHQQLAELPLPPMLEPRMDFDGYRILRTLHASSRSHVYLATVHEGPDDAVVLKMPSIDMLGDSAYLERFLLEEWIARRIDNPHVLKACPLPHARHYLYTVTEFFEGRTLRQWMIDNPRPDLETVRTITEQIAKGLQAFHRLEMIHQDVRPDNILIDASGTVKIIDFGSTGVAGIAESRTSLERHDMLGTVQFTAPEYFLGAGGTPSADIFSLGVITYQMLTGKLPYGAQVARARNRAAQNKLAYRTIYDGQRDVPVWIDDVLKKALHPDPYRRYQELSEFTYELRYANQALRNKSRPPLIERRPVLFWQGVSLILLATVVALIITR